MKLIFLAVAVVLLCSLMSAEAAAPRRRIIRIRIIRIIPIRRGRRDVGEQVSVVATAENDNHLAYGELVATDEPDTLIYKYNGGDGDIIQEEIARLCDSVRQQVKQSTGEDVDFEVQMQPVSE